MKIENGVYKVVPLSWTGVTPPIKAGSPLDIDGVISNDGDAIGLVTQDIQYDVNATSTYLLVGGDVYLDEVEAEYGDELEDACKAALDGIRFHLADGSVFASGLPAVTEDDAGKVLMVDEDGAWVAGAGGLKVTVTHTYDDSSQTDSYTLDKNYTEIMTVVNNGITPIFCMSSEGTYSYLLFGASGEVEYEGQTMYVVALFRNSGNALVVIQFVSDSATGTLVGSED